MCTYLALLRSIFRDHFKDCKRIPPTGWIGLDEITNDDGAQYLCGYMKLISCYV